MKKSLVTAIVVLAAAICFIPVGYAQETTDKTTIQDVKQETQDLLKALKGYGAEQRDEALKQTEQALKKLDSRIESLQTRFDENWESMDQAAREKARASMNTLQQQRNELAEWYGRFKSSSASAWEQMKQGFSDAYQAFHETWQKTEIQYEADNKPDSQ